MQGRINIPFNTIPYNRNITRWFPLHPIHGRKSTVHGEIQLNLHLKVPRPYCDQWGWGIFSFCSMACRRTQMVKMLLDSLRKSKSLDGNRKQSASAAEPTKKRKEMLAKFICSTWMLVLATGFIQLDLNLVLWCRYLYNPPMGAWEGYLTLKVIEGRKIKMVGDKQADPYVVLSVGAVLRLQSEYDFRLTQTTTSRIVREQKLKRALVHQCGIPTTSSTFHLSSHQFPLMSIFTTGP